MSNVFQGIKLIPILDLGVSQIFLNKKKVNGIKEWFDSDMYENYEPLSVYDFGDGRYILTDGHSRAYIAYKSGVKNIPVRYDNDDIVVSELGLLQYSHNLVWCERFNIKLLQIWKIELFLISNIKNFGLNDATKVIIFCRKQLKSKEKYWQQSKNHYSYMEQMKIYLFCISKIKKEQ